MWCKTGKILLVVLVGLLLVACFGQAQNEEDKPAIRIAGKSPLDELPPYIRQVTHFGERADWSHDGKRILFLEKTFGDAYEVELATGIIRPMTHHYFHEGYTRALYLSNGDILLSGARKFDANDPWPSRSEKNAELWVLKKDLSSAPVPLGEKCSEGPAVSRRSMRIAWTQGGAFYMADIVYKDGKPELANKKKILDKKDLPFKCDIETQNFRPPDEKELVFSAYGYQGTEVMGLNLETGKVTNYSLAPNQYDEPEGIFPDGKYTLVECDKHNPKGTQYIDIYKLALDGSGKTERLTNFADYPGYKASNPVVSDDGRYMAFQVAKKGDAAGVGRGILIFDLEMYGKTTTGSGGRK
jgi:Tol biopolymer transport system component